MGLNLKVFFKRYFEHLLGNYNVEGRFDLNKVRDIAIPFTPKKTLWWWLWSSWPLKSGVFVVEINNENYYICQTIRGRVNSWIWTGVVYPSRFYLLLSPVPRLVPPPHRLAIGYVGVFFVAVITFITGVLCITEFPYGLLAIGFWLIIVSVFLGLSLIEKNLVLREFDYYCSLENK